MSEVEPREEAEREEEAPRVLAVEIGSWGPIREPVRVELNWPITVLVGRNGSGKTILLEGIAAGTCLPAGRLLWALQMQGSPGAYVDELALTAGKAVRYTYERSAQPSGLNEINPDFAQGLQLMERCTLLDSQETLWDRRGGRLELAGGRVQAVPPDISFLRFTASDIGDSGPRPSQWRDAHRALSALAGQVQLIPADLGRTSRVEVWLSRQPERYPDAPWPWVPEYAGEKSTVVDRLARFLWLWENRYPTLMVEFREICRRASVLSEIAFLERDSVGSTRREIAVDGANLGHCSDGTLRAMAILHALVAGRDGGLLLIDEIEASFHPGLLTRILEELRAYAGDVQIVLTTQSPRVVDWARPEEIRVVERKDGRIQVHALPEGDLRWLHEHLDGNYTLSDHVYGGALDDS